MLKAKGYSLWCTFRNDMERRIKAVPQEWTEKENS